MEVIEEQLGLPPTTSRNLLDRKEEILLIEDILKYGGTLYGKMKRSEGGTLSNEKCQYWKAITATQTVHF